VGHGLQHNLSREVMGQFAIAIPIILFGFGVGTFLSRYINPTLFRKLVLTLLIITGGRLVWMGIRPWLI
ncbi:MAG: sulfite exporter TauE/SafE family protein, partial [Leptolyngbyaceae bacterium]|nr:sulfite exporter TauE/SafE family protein [Leptolyngbyaceae bacterium]